jgi:MarR family transcriptional regulator, temperature-dependent positive regulator of motility
MSKAKLEPNGPLDRSPSHLLHRALQRALDIYAETAGPTAVTQRQYAVLAAVAAREGLTQADLVRSTGIDRSTLAELVARMLGKGLITRERSNEDGRANTVSLTDKGRIALDEAEPRARAADEAILKLVPSGKRGGFLSALRALSAERAKPAEDKPAKGKGKKDKKDKKKKAKKAKKAKKSADSEPTLVVG